MQRTQPLPVQDLLLVGGGHSHVQVLRSFGMEPMDGVRVSLLCRDTHAPYSGMLPGLIAGHYEYDEAHIDLVRLARWAGVRFLHDEAVGIDRVGRELHCRDRPPLRYDLLSINIGSRPRTADVPGAPGAVVPVKPIDGFWAHWQRLRERCLARRERTVIAVVGGGAGGVELLLSMQYALGEVLAAAGRDDGHLEYCLYTASTDVLPTHNRGVRSRFRRILRQRGVKLFTERRVSAVEEREGRKRLHLDDGTSAGADEVLWVTTAAAQPWPGASGLSVDEGGFIRVDDRLRSITDPRVFAAGDIASMVGHPRPKSGVFAVRQGPPLTENLRRALLDEPLQDFKPQERFLSLIGTGDRRAVASRSFWSLEGRWVWRWKEWIDRRFMERFEDLPAMEPDERGLAVTSPEPAAEAMRCAACGSKVAGDLLGRALARLEPGTRPDVVAGLDAPDDAAAVSVPAGKLLVETVDFFRAPFDDPFQFGRLTANHALGDVLAMGAEPQSALAIVQVARAGEAQMEQDVFHMLAGAVEALRAAGAVLAGGHTVEGDDMALGFAVTGLVGRERMLRKSGLQAGQALVVTKGLGTGALLAAEMRGRARGRWVQTALASMTLPDVEAARILGSHGATAMTDVTGFGLAGHLIEMLRASGVDAELELARLPALPGALEVMEEGIVSTLHPANARVRASFAASDATDGEPRVALLFDPQTAGGLLAGIPADRADAVVEALRAAGYERACRIGTVSAGDDGGGRIALRAAFSD